MTIEACKGKGKDLMLNVEVDRKPVKEFKKGFHMIRVTRYVNDFGTKMLGGNGGPDEAMKE